MEPTQNLSDFFSNNAQGSGGSPGTSLSGFLDATAKSPAPQGRVSDVSAIIAQEGADHLKPVIEAIYKQESGAGSNARTSIDGAHGGMQIIPATFQRYAKPGERIDNPDDNMRVGVRIIKDLAGKFGNDPAKIATGYFSGEGNVNGGQGSAWKNDRADGNGKRVSGYVADILAKVGGISNAQAAQPASAKPDLAKAPKWADIAAKPEFSSLPADKQAQAKSAYFDYYIAPHAGQQAEALRQQFMQSPNGTPERTWGEAGADTGVQLAEGVNTILGAIPNLVAPESGVAGFFNDNAQFWRDKQSNALKGKISKADQAITKAGEDGVIAQIAEAASQYFQDPALAARFVTTNLPSMIPGIGAAKLAQGAALARGASAARAAQIATTAAGATNAALNAGGARGEAFEDIKRTLIQQGMSPEQAEQQALADSRIVAVVGGIAGYVSGKTGLEKSLFGQATTKGAIKSGVAATATELAGEQLEEVSPQIATNIQAGKYDNRSIGKDVGRTIVETAIGSGPGAVVAGGAAAMNKAPESVSITPDGRIEPTMTGEAPVQAAEPAPVDVHPTVQTADAIVRDLATEAGVPLETVLPTAAQPTTGPEVVGDQDVQAFAEGRYQQLRAKRDGQIETTVGETGIVDQDAAGAGLSPQEQQELAGLEQARGDVAALRTLYGLDQSIPSDQSQLATQANEAAPATGPVAQPEAGQQFPATMEPGLLAAQENQSENGQDPQPGAAQHQVAGDGIAAEQGAAAVQESATDPAIAQAPVGNAVGDAGQQGIDIQPKAPVTESEADREARLEREAIQAEGEIVPEETGQYADIPLAPFEDAPPAKPRTEKEARAQRDYTGKWFGTQDKAAQFIAKQGIGDTHAVVQDGKKFLIQKKESSNANQAAQAQQTEAQGSERQQAPAAPEVGQQQETKPAPKTEKEARGMHYAAGEADFAAGKPRELPSYHTSKTGKNAKEWYRGWDAAKQQADSRVNGDEKNSTNSDKLILEKQDNEGQNGSKENASDAKPVQPEPVSARTSTEDQQNVADGNRDSEPLGAGLAADSEGLDSDRGVSGSPQESGTGRSDGEAGTGPESPIELGESSGVRPEPTPASSKQDDDHVIDADEIGKGGLGQKYRDNVAAIKIIKTLEAEGRTATPEERKTLAKYVGWGAMKGPFDPDNKAWAKQHAELKELLTAEEFRAARASTLDAHYTSPVAVGAMYDALARLGVKSGRVLEPSVGVGNFFGLMPREMRNASQLHGVELDSLTSRLVAALYPKAKIAKATGFQDFEIPSEYFDVVIGNPPFGSHPLVDKERSPYSGFSIHNYFLAKSIDKLRPGGVMAIVVSHNFLDAQDGRVRKWIGERASLIGGVRLPNTAFKENAGTEVVTDILIFQKHDKNGLPSSIAPWQDVVEQININPKTGEHAAHKVSQFFVSNPQFVLGKPSAGGTMYSANEYTVEQDGNIKDALAKWVKTLPENVFDNIDRARDSAVVDMAVPDGVKVGSFYVDATGKVMRRGDDLMGEKTAQAWEPRYESQVGRMKGMIAIRDTLRQQMRLERSVDATEQEIEANRAELNRLYDDFLKKYKHLNSTTNRSIFLDDTEAHLIQGLEFDYDKGVGKATAEKEGIEQREASATKADIFQRRVAFPPQDYMTVSTAKDALLASLNYRGRVDGAYMAEVYGKPMGEIVKELGDVVFDDPQAGIVTADEYLSGDVKTKLAEAKAAAQDDAKYRRNVEALEKVIPKDKTPSEISVSIGAAFVPAEIYEQFVKHISGGSATASYVKATGQWLMAFNTGSDPALNTGRFGTSDLSAQDLFQLTMFGRGAVVKKTLRNADGSTTTILLEKETEAAREKQNAIKAEWQKWLWQDPERADRIASLYNDKMNRIVVRTFDGSHMGFPGMNPAISLLAHQKNGVWRGLQSYQVLYDHVVGAGKTFEMATLAMEMRRLGIARKPVFVVPNHLTLQWRSEFTRLYPGSNILAATPEDFSKDNRERLFAKIITGDWDAVVIGHSSLKKIGLPEKTEIAVLQEQIDELADAIEDMKRARGDKRITADMERIRKNLDAKMKDKLAAVGKRSKMVTFDELGIDAMFIDEMHEFKNLTYNTTMDRNPGMGNPAGSAKAFDLFVKVRWLFDTFGDKTPFITATGTPVSNSLVEMFNMQRYMQYPTLKREGLHVFDAWAKQFGSVENVYEVAPSGSGYRQSTRFAKFTNLPGLMSLYNSFADTITLDDLKAQEEAQGKRFPVPKMVSGRPVLVVAKRSPAVAALMGVPKAQTDEAGGIQFGADLSAEIQIEQDEKSGKWMAKVGDAHLGQFETAEDARLKVVERALTPVVSVDPQSILGRFANLRQLTKETKGKVNALSLTGEANKAGLDYRLIDPAAPDFAGSKINLAVDNMLRTYKQWQADRGTQLVFCDLSIPLSARASYSSKARRLYVRDDAGGVEMKRGTMHALPGHEDLPYFVIQRGEKDAKRFDVYDAASGLRLQSDFRSKQDAIEAATGFLGDDAKRQKWINARESAGEIEQGEIDEYNNEHDVDTENPALFFMMDDIQGMSGSAKFSVYDDIKAKLIAKGVPEREIAFIHDYSTPAAKDKLFRAVNAGEVRFLLGSTPKMGAGTNVQKRLVGLHHIDAPWRPSDLEQREGRIIRRGNELYARDPDNFEVFIGRYATEQTYDTRRWQILEHKARGIEQLRNYDGTINEIDDIEGEAANAADMKAAASGDPLILEETKLRNDVRRLEQLQAGHADEVLSMTRKARDAQEYADTHGPAAVREIKDILTTTAKHPVDKEGFAPVTVQGGKPLSDKEAAHKTLASVFENVRSHMIDTASVQYRGLTFKLEHFAGNVILRTPTGNGGAWSATDPFSPSGMVQRLKNYIDRLPAMQDETQARIEKSKKDAESMRELAKQPFPQAKDLEAAREEHKKIQRALMAKGPEVPENQKAAVAAGMEQQKAKLRELGFGDALNEFFSNDSGPAVLATTGNSDPLPESEWLSEAQFAQVIEERIGKFGHQPPVLIRDSVIDVPHMRQASAGSAAGVTTGGKIYLFRDANATTADVVQTLWHELVHYGLRRFLTKEQYIAQMQKLYDRDPWVKAKADAWLATDGDDVKQARKAGEAYARARGVDEALAELAETSEGEYRNNTLKAKAIRQAARWIAAVAERFGFHEFAAKYRAIPNDEARALVRSMFQKLRDDAPATSSDWAFTADPAFMVRRIQNNLIQFFGNRKETLKTFGKYDKTLSTQYHKALKDKHYGKVFAYVNAMQNEVSLTSIRPAELAPGVLPRVDDVKSALRGIVKGKHADKNLTQAADAVFAGTLHGSNVMAGKVWSDDELRGKFGMNDTGIALYRQTRAAIDASLDEVAAAEAYAMAQGIVPKAMRRQIIDNPRVAESLIVGELESQIKLLNVAIRNAKRQGNEQQQAEYEAVRGQYSDTKRKVEKIFVTAKNLKLAGYAPLMRFGKWTVTVQSIDPTTGNVLRDDEGKPLTEYFGKFETEGEAISVRHQMEAKYKDRDDIRVKAGVDSQAAHELYAGISPETIALFGEAVGATEVTQKYYQMALSERSALKRRLERKGTAGYSEDLPRVLSNFITSNGRFAAQRFYLRDLNNAIKYIPQEKGDVKDEAMRLKQFVMQPDDKGASISSVMFAWFLGGSVAAALVNMTQPVMMTGPYLSQHGVATASKALAKVIPYAMGKKEITDAELKAALKRASQEGIVDAQEIFHLYSVGAQNVASGLVNSLARLPGVGSAIKAGSEDARARVSAFMTLWGSMFSLAEGFNRKLTFLAAWDVAKANKEANPYAFAVRAVNETQGIYNKVNRPNWARGTAGRAILTFKQFSLMYIELLSRMWKRGGPEGKRAALIMLAMLMLASGEEGLPFAQDLDDLIDTIGQMFGLDTNMRRNKRRLAHEILGKTLGDLFLYGVSAQLPIDLSGRLGLGNMIPGTGLLKPSDEQMRGRNVAEIFGPTAGMATQIGDAYDAATEGNPGKALQNLAPKAIKDLMAAGEMTKKGYATDAKGRKVVDVGLGDAVAKGVGFNPTKVAQEHRKTMPIQQDIALQKHTESAIVDQWARGIADGDEAMVNDAMKRRDNWNESNPKTPIAIRSTQIRDRVRQMATEKDARLLKQAPKEMRGTIGLELIDDE